MNLLERYSYSPTQRHLNGMKHIFHYLLGNIDMSLFIQMMLIMNLLGMLMQDFYLIHIKVDLKHVISLRVVILLYHGDLQSKH